MALQEVPRRSITAADGQVRHREEEPVPARPLEPRDREQGLVQAWQPRDQRKADDPSHGGGQHADLERHQLKTCQL